jgi:tetratricopeptide (TPR) repeat protein
LAEKHTVTHHEHGEHKAAQSRALLVTSEILRKKWLVIGVPVAAVAVALILIFIHSSRRKSQVAAAEAYEKSDGQESFVNAYKAHGNTVYGAYSLAAAAREALNAGKYGEAKELANEFLEVYPESIYAGFVKRYLGLASEGEGDYQKAIDIYKDVLENEAMGQRIGDSLNIDIGRCYEQIGDYETAKSYYRKVAPPIGPGGRSSQADIRAMSQEASLRMYQIGRKEKKSADTAGAVGPNRE